MLVVVVMDMNCGDEKAEVAMRWQMSHVCNEENLGEACLVVWSLSSISTWA
jgi:hypothetical protein